MKLLTYVTAMAVITFSTVLANAQSATDCFLDEYTSSAAHIPQPWEVHTRLFANGAVRVTLLDTIEPAVAAVYLMVQSPPHEETFGSPECRILGTSPSNGFADIAWDDLVAGYDPTKGLQFEVPVQVFNPDSGDVETDALAFTVNQATGAIDTSYAAGGSN